MPFSVQAFLEEVESHTKGKVDDNLIRLCEQYGSLTTPKKRAACIKEMMDLLDASLNTKTRQAIMETCGRHCIGRSKSVIEKALRIKKQSSDVDDLLRRLNDAHIGGGNLTRTGKAIYASYDRCYCGSVSKSTEHLSPTYCHCSCGWYRRLFEILLDKPVKVELLSSIIQGDAKCRFVIRHR